MAENNVYVQLTVDEKKALASITKFTKSMEQSTKKIESRFDKLSGKFDSFVGNLSAKAVSSAIGFFTRAVSQAASSAIDFEKAVAEVNTLLPKSSKLTSQLKKDLVALSGEFGVDKAEQARAYYQIISSGAAEGQAAIELLTQANTLASAGLADLGDSVNVITDIINIYGAENITAQEAADALFQTVKLGKTTIQELSTNIGAVLPAASRLGIGLKDVGAALATLTTQGLSTSQRVTQLNALFTALFKKGGDAAKKFGQKVGDAFSLKALREKGLQQFLIDLAEATGNNEEVLVSLLGRTEAAQAVFGLTGKAADSLAQKMKGMADSIGAADEAAKENNDTFSKQWQKTTTNISNIIGVILAPKIKTITENLKIFNDSLKVTSAEKISMLANNVSRLEQEQKKLLIANRGNAKWNEEQLKKYNEITEALKRARDAQAEYAAGLIGAGARGTQTEVTPTDTGDNTLTDFQKKQNALIVELTAAREAKIQEIEGLSKMARIAGADEDLEFRKQIFERQKELRVLDDESKLAEKITTEEELAALDFKFKGEQLQRELELSKEQKKIEDEKKKRSEQLAKDQASFEAANSRRTVSLAQNTANLLNAVAGEQTKAGFLIGQAAAAANVLIADGQARASATVAASNASALAALGGPQNAIATFTATLAKYNALITANTALSLGTIAAQTLGGLAGGGVIGGFGGATSGGDNMLQPVRTGEMVLNAQQQEELFNSIQGGSMGGDVVVQIDGREIARAVRDQKQQGFFV